VNGTTVYDPAVGISGTLQDAIDNLAHVLDANRTLTDNQPGWEFCPI
jgi:hypothetical protein